MAVRSLPLPRTRARARAQSFGLQPALLIGVAVLIGFPFVYAVLISLMDASQVMAPNPRYWPLDFSNYPAAWSAAPFGRYLVNSLVVSLAITAGSVLTSVLAAYVFARAQFPGRDALFMLVVATLMIPSYVTLIPNYLTMAKLGLLDSYAALVLPFLASGFVTFFLRQHFRGIPRELDEAALIDGATSWQILWRVIVPIARPAIAAMALFQFLSEWNSYLWPLIVTDSDATRTLQIGLARLLTAEADDGIVDWPVMLAGSVLVMLPTIVAFAVAERNLGKGFAVTVSK